MTDSNDLTNAPLKRTSRLRPPPTEPQAETQGAEAASPSTTAQAPVQAEPEPLAPAVPAPFPIQSAPIMIPDEAALPPTPERGKPIPNSPFHEHDVVQIMDPASRLIGGFFMVGDVLRDKVHGYYLTEGRHKEFVTIERRFCWYIGPSKVRSPVSCSPKWLADVGRPQTPNVS